MTTLIWREFKDDQRTGKGGTGEVLRVEEGSGTSEDKEETQGGGSSDRRADTGEDCKRYAPKAIRHFRVSYPSKRGGKGVRYPGVQVQEDGRYPGYARPYIVDSPAGVQGGILGDKEAEGQTDE